MKKLLLTISLGLLAISSNAQAPVDFTSNDCNSVSHNLFNELNSGKIVLLAWVMPCGSCTAACQVAWNVANSYSVSNPGQVVFYIADDVGTTSCGTLNNWVISNSLTCTTKFTNSVINMSDYGTVGMPKLVVFGGISTHSVYYNVNGSANINTSAVQNAVNLALNDVTGINEISVTTKDIKLSPSPASSFLQLTFQSTQTKIYSVDIYNSLGQKSKSLTIQSVSGENKNSIDVSELPNGVYFLKLTSGKVSEPIKFIIAH